MHYFTNRNLECNRILKKEWMWLSIAAFTKLIRGFLKPGMIVLAPTQNSVSGVRKPTWGAIAVKVVAIRSGE